LPRFFARLVGSGTTETIGYGLADAELSLMKELDRALPGARLIVRVLSRVDPEPRIVESYQVNYELKAAIEVDAENPAAARRTAFASAREALLGTRLERVEWKESKVTEV
jgi:hypothetical protein